MANFKIVFVLILQIRFLYSVPLLPMQGYQMMPLVDQASLQQQIMALQRLQMMQNLKTIHSPSTLYIPQPMIIMLPDQPVKETKDESNSQSGTQNDKSDKEYVDEDLDAVIIEAADAKQNNIIKNDDNQLLQPKRALVLLPDGRQIIGSIISQIPWLPFEVNVPDTIAWAYNGISNGIAGIISIIGGGSRNPFRPYPQDVIKPESNLKLFLKRLQMKKDDNVVPIIIMPTGVAPIPMPVNNFIPVGSMPAVWSAMRSLNPENGERLREE